MGQEIEVRPGIVSKDGEGKLTCNPIYSRIVSLFAEQNDLQYAAPGGLIGETISYQIIYYSYAFIMMATMTFAILHNRINTFARETKLWVLMGFVLDIFSLSGVGTKIDPTVCRADRMVGQVLGAVGALPEIFTELEISFFLLRRLLGVRTEGDKKQAKVCKSGFRQR